MALTKARDKTLTAFIISYIQGNGKHTLRATRTPFFDVLPKAIPKHKPKPSRTLWTLQDTPQGTLSEKKRSKLVQATGYNDSSHHRHTLRATRTPFFDVPPKAIPKHAEQAEPYIVDVTGHTTRHSFRKEAEQARTVHRLQ